MKIDSTKLLEMTSEGYWLVSPQQKIIEVNHSFCNMSGYEKEEILGRMIFDFIDDENIHIFTTTLAKLMEQNNGRYEITIRKKNGESVNCSFKGAAVCDKLGDFQGVFVFITEITDRKRAEEALRESENKFRLPNKKWVFKNVLRYYDNEIA